MFSRHNRVIGVFYLCADTLLALISFWVAWEVRSYLILPRPLYSVSNYSWIVPLSVGIWVLVGLSTGIYRDIKEEDLRRAFSDPLKVGLIGTVLLFAATFAIKFQYLSRLLLVLYAATDLLAMTLFRLVARRFAGPLRRSLAGLRSFLLVGEGLEALEVARTIEAHESGGMRLLGFVRTGAAPPSMLDQSALRGSYPVFDLPELQELLHKHVIDEVIFAISKDDLERLGDSFRVFFGVTIVLFGVVRATGAVMVPLCISAVSLLGVRFPIANSLLEQYHAEAIWWTFRYHPRCRRSWRCSITSTADGA